MDEEVKGKAKGGLARAAKLTLEQRKDIAQNAASARWRKHKEGAMSKDSKNNRLIAVLPAKGAALKQGILDLGIHSVISRMCARCRGS